MKVEELIIGALCIFWGIFGFVNRDAMYDHAREGGRGLRDIRILKPLVLTATAILPVVGVVLIITSITQ